MACSLQVNCGPDMKNTGSRLDHVVVSFLEDTLAAAVDPYFDPGTQPTSSERVLCVI
jgi:hypothetical protein